MTQTDYMTIDDVAQRLGVEYKSAKTFHERAQRNRRNGVKRTADMPAPDARYGRSPVWKPRTIEAWLPKRGQR